MTYLAISLIVAVVVIVGVSGYRYERRVWNGGVCRESGKPWVHFDDDSQGGRGYVDDPKCGAGTNVCWISWPGIDSAIGNK